MAWDWFTETAGDIWESVSGEIGEVYDATKQYALDRLTEQNTDPEYLKQNEPLKGTAADGSTVVATTAAPQQGQQAQLIQGVDNRVLIAAGAGVVLLLLLGTRK